MTKLSIAGMKELAQLTKSDILVMLEILEIMDKTPICNESNRENLFYVTVHKPKIQMNTNTVNDSIRNLYNAGILLRQEKGVYTISERLFN